MKSEMTLSACKSTATEICDTNQAKCGSPLKGQYVEGALADLTPWAYVYRKDLLQNPTETQWLWSGKRMYRDGSIWSFKDTEGISRLCPKENVLCAFLWEEPRMINSIEIEFLHLHGEIPDLDDITVFITGKGCIWGYDDADTYQFDPTDNPLTTGADGTVFHFFNRYWFDRKHEQKGLVGQKLFIVYRGGNKNIGIPNVRVFGNETWKKPLTVEIEWGFDSKNYIGKYDGRIEAYNGFVELIEPLETGNGLTVVDKFSWMEYGSSEMRRGMKARVFPMDGDAASRTIVTMWSERGNVSFAIQDLDEGPILIPSIGIFITKEDNGLTFSQFKCMISSNNAQTTRELVREHAEYSIDAALKAFYPGRSDFPEFPTPPFEPAMKISVPDRWINNQWRVGAWHLLRCSERLTAETCCISIFPKNYATFFCGGGMVTIGLESYQIIRALDIMGMHDYAEGGVNYWLYGDHAAPFLWYGELMGDGALCNSYSGPDLIAQGYDQKHYGGHARILETALFHYKITDSKEWYKKAEPVLEKACEAIVRVRQEWMKQLSPKTWAYGLMPPGIAGDTHEIRAFYSESVKFYSALKEAVRVLSQEGSKTCMALTDEADSCIRDLRKAVERSAALTPVIKVGDGTYRRYVSWQPYMRGSGIGLPMGIGEGGLGKEYLEGTLGGLNTVPLVFSRDESIVQDMLDVCEDIILPRVSEKADEEARITNWLVRWGPQGGHEPHHSVHLLTDDIPVYIRDLYNMYASEVDPDNGYIFWEVPLKGGSNEKPFEEAAFLERIRMMLVMEENDSLWLARATPREWLTQGKKISVANAPTFFGTMDYTITSDVLNHCISAAVTPPNRKTPNDIFLRLRHPTKVPIRKVMVNGSTWVDFNIEHEFVRLHSITGQQIQVTVFY